MGQIFFRMRKRPLVTFPHLQFWNTNNSFDLLKQPFGASTDSFFKFAFHKIQFWFPAVSLCLQHHSLWSAISFFSLRSFQSSQSARQSALPTFFLVFSDVSICSIYISTSIVSNLHSPWSVISVASLFFLNTSPIYSTSHLPHLPSYLAPICPRRTVSSLLSRRPFQSF